MKILKKISKRLSSTQKAWKSDCNFSKKYAWLRVKDELGGRLGFKRVSEKAYQQKKEYIMNYLNEMLAPVVRKYKDNSEQGVFDPNSPIWVCWWTGEDDAPELVQKCIKSIRKNAGNHPVNLITEDTYKQYIVIPFFILDKVKNKKIGLAHLADYIRVSLLADYGGLWIDATIFCSQPLPEKFFNVPFFTCKSEKTASRYISNYEWVTFFLGGWKGNVFYQFLKDAFELYWSTAEVAIDYLFFDYVIYIAKEKIPSINRLMNDVPINTVHRDDLQAAMNADLPASEFDNIIQDDTEIYKLSWREQYSLLTKDGQKSIYAYFLENL